VLYTNKVETNRPDMALREKKKRKVFVIDVAIPNTHNISIINYCGKTTRKYCELKQEIKRLWKVEDVRVVPLIISTTGVISKCLHESIKLLELTST